MTDIVHSKTYHNGGQVVVEEYEQTVKKSVLDDHNGMTSPPAMPIAEREHRKWLTPDIDLANNPYSVESIEQRTRQMHSLTDSEEAESSLSKKEEEKEEPEEVDATKKKFFS